MTRDRGRDNNAIVTDMLASIAYRGPNEQGFAVCENLVLGHNRLTIMEPSGGQQPRVNEANGNTLIYNGEIYDHRSFDSDIQAAGGDLRDHCDTETLFWLLELHGVAKTLSMIDGMFAFAWYEAGSRTLYLARDRFGQKPLFYSQTGMEFVFASEIKALRRHPSLSEVTPDIDALRSYLLMEYVPGPATGISEIKELPAGHVLTYRAQQATVESYWQVGDINREAEVDVGLATSKLDELLNTAVQQQLVADVPLGIFLSGGLDSSLIAAIARKHSKDVATFTVKFPYASFDESQHAEQVAASIGTRHTTVELNRQNCTDGIEYLLSHSDQPFCDSSSLPSYLLCQATKRYVTVALGGDGADELFLGYPNFKILCATRLMAVLPQAAGAVLRAAARALPNSTAYMNRGFLLRQFSYGIGKPAHQQSIHWMSAVPAEIQTTLWHDGGAPQLQNRDDEKLSLIEQCQRHFVDAYLAGDILQKMDRASMYNSLEVRSPFLSAPVADYALSLPISALLKGMTGKQILRRIGQNYLPEQTVTRGKHGFALPVSTLLRSDLRDLASSSLLDSSNAMYGHIKFDAVAELWSEHIDNKRDHGKSLWALLAMAAFFRNQF